jgi:hypothetical protein
MTSRGGRVRKFTQRRSRHRSSRKKRRGGQRFPAGSRRGERSPSTPQRKTTGKSVEKIKARETPNIRRRFPTSFPTSFPTKLPISILFHFPFFSFAFCLFHLFTFLLFHFSPFALCLLPFFPFSLFHFRRRREKSRGNEKSFREI